MAATGIQASGYHFTDIPVSRGLLFKFGSLFIHIIELGSDDGSKMLGFSFVVACGANVFLYLTLKMSLFLFFNVSRT